MFRSEGNATMTSPHPFHEQAGTVSDTAPENKPEDNENNPGRPLAVILDSMVKMAS
jgi:hypothetical protein